MTTAAAQKWGSCREDPALLRDVFDGSDAKSAEAWTVMAILSASEMEMRSKVWGTQGKTGLSK